MKIIGISGSIRKNSLSQAFLRFMLAKMKEKGVEVSEIDLKKINLPFYFNETDDNKEAVFAYRQKMEEADGLLIVNPEYHGSISGVLKNALDFLETKKMGGKMAALVTILGGDAGGFSLEHLTTVARKLHLWLSPQTLIIPRCDESILADGTPTSKEIKERVDLFIDKFYEGLVKLYGT